MKRVQSVDGVAAAAADRREDGLNGMNPLPPALLRARAGLMALGLRRVPGGLLDLQLQVLLDGDAQLHGVHRGSVHLPGHPLCVPLHLLHRGIRRALPRAFLNLGASAPTLVRQTDFWEDVRWIMSLSCLHSKILCEDLRSHRPDVSGHGPHVASGAAARLTRTEVPLVVRPGNAGWFAHPGATEVAALEQVLSVQARLTDRGGQLGQDELVED